MQVLEFCPTRGVCAARYHNEPIRGRKSPCCSYPPHPSIGSIQTTLYSARRANASASLNCATLGNQRLASNANLSHRKRPNLVRVKTFLGRKHPRATARTTSQFPPLQWDDRPSREPRATNGRGYCMSQTQRSHTAVPVHSPNSLQGFRGVRAHCERPCRLRRQDQ